MGDASGVVISPEEEKRLGEAFMREVRRSLKVVDDPELESYIQAIGTSLVSHADSDIPEFTFFLVQNSAINAFAAPGGYIGVHTGLILATQNESELASVLAHEISHITQRHLPRSLDDANKMSLPATAALLAAIILGRNSAAMGEAALATTLAGHAQAQINFTRSHEEEADRIGMQLLSQSGFDPRGMPEFFERLQQSYRFYDNNLPEFLSTHPVTISRIADSRNRAEQFEHPKPNPYSSYAFMRAKVRVTMQASAQENLAYFKNEMAKSSGEERLVASYGYTLALMSAGKLDEATAMLQPLLKQEPDRISFILANATIDHLKKNYAGATKILADGLALYPGDHAMTILMAEALINKGDPEAARRLLQEHLRKRGAQPAVYKLFARATNDSGRDGESHYALAEYYYLSGETSTAVQQLKLAAASTPKDDFYLSSRIDARLKQLKEELATLDPAKKQRE